ncbi:peptidase S9, prolyl oligopeptidase active site region [Acidisarcina polymorpha]|uniref:Peptidase S9, prolyl oligopeptidase active site region n=1 Tax=Acidisarcina polymorpha TaxID=2211140 RepID=A0A2Z5G8U6_9BACT|nr:S9 family peptidase [Acidisarcina polymorpha]AXC15390.1 peptidase S9, prolyl oligopeptidase active site region [Acidisarcina polymorpha]
MKSLSYLVLGLLVTPLFGQPRPITLQDLVSTGAAGRRAGVLAPDGKHFAVIQQGQLALLPVDGGAAVPLTDTAGAKSEVSWSRDSRKLAFVSGGDIWVVSASGGQARELTSGPVGPGDPRGATDHFPMWNPNGHWILFQSGRRGWNELYVVSDDGKTRSYIASTEIYSGRDQIGNSSPDHGDAVSSDRFDPNPAWSPDGKSISYTERSRAFFSGKLKLIGFNSATGTTDGSARDLYIAKNDRGGAWAVNTVAWSPDSTTLAVVLQETGWDKIFLISAAGLDQPKQLTTGESEDENPVYSPDGSMIAFVSNRDLPEERHIWIVPVKGGAPRRLTHEPGIEGTPQWSPDSKTLYFSRGTALRTASTYSASINGGGDLRPIEPPAVSIYEQAGLPPPEVAHFSGKDGLPLAGILYRPLGFKPGVKYPAVIWAHGGPEGQDVLGLSPWSLFLAQRGFLVFEPNFRGSTGYGEKFRNLNVEDSGGGEIDDIGAAVGYLVQQGLGDPKRVAIGGGSHGGTVVANAVTKLPDTFAAGLELFGVVDRALFLQYTNRNSKIRWETKMGGTPEEKPAVYRKANILPDVDKIRTPLLIMHGEEDPQVPPQESAEFVEALKKGGKTYDYVTYPREGHGFQEREHRLDAYRKQLAFLEKYLQPDSPIAAPE